MALKYFTGKNIHEMTYDEIVNELNILCYKSFEEKKGGGNELEYDLYKVLYSKYKNKRPISFTQRIQNIIKLIQNI